jgi:hypothetical protein
MLAPEKNGSHTDPAPHVDAGIQRLALVGWSCLRIAECNPSQATTTSADWGRASPLDPATSRTVARPAIARYRRARIGDETIATEALDHRVEQHALQAAMDRELRHSYLHATCGLAVDELPKAVEERRLARADRHARQGGLETETRQLARAAGC